MPMRILALDTSTEACSVALWNDGEISALYEVAPRDHAKRILPMLQQLLLESGITLHQLDALAFGRGPGSFTGVRIGIGIAQGLALGADLPLIPISTLQTLAEGAWRVSGCQQVMTAIDARMGEVYWGAFTRQQSGEWQIQCAEAVLPPAELPQYCGELAGEWAYAGTGWQSYPDLMQGRVKQLTDSHLLLPTAEDMLPLALSGWQRGEQLPVEDAEPVYLRNEVTWQKLPGR